MQTYYDEISDGYEELHREEQLKKIALIKKHLKVNPKEKLLDVGCGTGLTTTAWQCIRYGVDPALKLLAKAQQKESKHKNSKAGVKYTLASAEYLPFRDNEFDIVISITAIQNFQNIEKGLREIKRVGKNKFVLSFLKKSLKKGLIDGLIRKIFKVTNLLEEEKDLIYFCT